MSVHILCDIKIVYVEFFASITFSICCQHITITVSWMSRSIHIQMISLFQARVWWCLYSLDAERSEVSFPIGLFHIVRVPSIWKRDGHGCCGQTHIEKITQFTANIAMAIFQYLTTSNDTEWLPSQTASSFLGMCHSWQCERSQVCFRETQTTTMTMKREGDWMPKFIPEQS